MTRLGAAPITVVALALAACGGGGGSGGAGNAAHRVPSVAVGAATVATPTQAVGASQPCPTGELFTANAAHWVAVHDRMAFGDRPPARILSGASTGFVTGADAAAPRGVAVDVLHDELLVSAGTTIRAFPRSASGDHAPARTIGGPAAGLTLAGKLALDAVHDEVWVVDGARLRAFARDAAGDAAPRRTITAGSPFSDVAVDPGAGDEVLAIYSGNVVGYGRTASGAAPFVRVIGGAGTTLRDPRALALDLVHGELFVVDWASTATTCAVAVFARSANGEVAPLRRIIGFSTGLLNPNAIAYDADRDELVVTNGAPANSVVAFARTASGDAAPRRTLSPTGALFHAAGLSGPQALAIAPATATCAGGDVCAVDGCAPPGTRDCGEGHYCAATATCEQLTPGMVCGNAVNPPPAAAVCAFGTTCPAGWVCASGGCMPAGGSDCGAGTYCASGLTCSIFTHNQCAAPAAADCGNGSYCAAGTSCVAGGLYCQPPGVVDCGSGWYCDAGLVCAASGGGYACNPPGSGGGAYCYSTSACILGAYGTCDCAGAASQTQCLSGHPACAGVGSACGDGTHACCGGETCINGRCEAGCGRCAGKGCTP